MTSHPTCKCGGGLRYEHCCKSKDMNPQYWQGKAAKAQRMRAALLARRDAPLGAILTLKLVLEACLAKGKALLRRKRR